MRRWLGILVAALAVGAEPATAQAPQLVLTAHNGATGHVDLAVSGPPGATVTITDTSGAGPAALAPVTLDALGKAILPRAADWTCDNRTRTFHADAVAPDGTASVADASVRTPSCARRFTVAVSPQPARVGRPLVVAVRDRWRLGGAARACTAGPGGRGTCREIRFARGRAEGRARLPVATPGRWRVDVRAAGARRGRERVVVRPAHRKLRLLATGDSMIQIVDGFLKQSLERRRVTVRSDARISTGLSKPFLLNWPNHARGQARSWHPDVTVMFIGANDGYPIGDVPCCGEDWSSAYAQRAAGMMRTYARGGRGLVYWNLLPAPRGANFAKVFAGVNRGLRLAARRRPDAVRLVDLPQTFTPDGRFRQTIRWHGRTVSVRQGDGVHLNVAGARIAAQLMLRRIREDGAL